MKRISLLIIFSVLIRWTSGQEIASIIVEAGATDRYETPVTISLDNLTFLPDSLIVLLEWEKKTKKEIPYQIEHLPQGRTISWIATSGTKANTKRKYTLEKGQPEVLKNVINVNNTGEAILITSGEDKVVSYHYETMPAPKGAKYEFRRSGFIHPLWSPDGEVLTDVQPSDHYHHYGIWNPWTRSTFEGKSVDFWNLADGQGTVRFKAFNSLTGGNVFGGLKVLQEHVVFYPGYEKIAMNELVTMKVWNVKDENDNKVWLWDFSSTLNPFSSSIVLNEYRYGGFSIRATPEWTVKTSEILTSEGKNRKDGDNTTARWMFCNGNANGKQSGVMFLSYPANYNYPEPIRIWPENLNYVFMNFSPTKNKDWSLEAGKDYTLRYRVVVYSGKMTAEKAEQYWQDFANPPAVSIKINK